MRVLLAKYSVIPLNFPYKNVFFDIGPLISPAQFFFLIILNAFSKDLVRKTFYREVIFFFEKEKPL